MIDYNTLNPEQREAVMTDYPRILTLAGAGTGKTQVLTRRIARLWEQGTDPANMLALTFTRAAGAEMKERVIGLIGDDGKRLFCNTFHAFCVELIREQADKIGYEPNFTIYDQSDSMELIAEITSDLKLKASAKAFSDTRRGKGDRLQLAQRKQAEQIVKEYDYRLKQSNAIDLDGLIPLATSIMERHEAVRAEYRKRYRYVFVDEFQDTDKAQWELVCKWLNPINLFVVGDDFQSIYQFRGSDITIILGLAQDPEWKTVKLERNYRSTQPIITAANALIKHNTQTEKQLTTNKEGVAVEYREPQDDTTEITEIRERLEKNIEAGIKTAILTRTNKQIERARELLKGIPVNTTSAGANPINDGLGAKHLVAWITAICNPQDDSAVKRIASPQMAKYAMLEAEKAQLDTNEALIDALRATDVGALFAQTHKAVSEEFIYNLNRGGLHDAITALIRQTHFEVGQSVIKAIDAWEHEQRKLGEPANAESFLNWVRLCNIAEKPAKELTADQIHLMTVHGSKGLEFDEVYIIGAAQGTFPSKGNIEEERRLFYVAITRARERLNISRPLTISDWNGTAKATERSQFINEIGGAEFRKHSTEIPWNSGGTPENGADIPSEI